MKRNKVLDHLKKNGCILEYEGRKHSVFINPENDKTSTVPRHREIIDWLANKICKDLDVPKIKN